MKKKQAVVRTITTPSNYKYNSSTMEHLSALLEQGYVVVMCNHIGNDLEYIVEKEIEE